MQRSGKEGRLPGVLVVCPWLFYRLLEPAMIKAPIMIAALTGFPWLIA
jgi:hypothetical protein